MGSKYVIDGNTVYEVDDACKRKMMRMAGILGVSKDEDNCQKKEHRGEEANKDKRIGKVSIC